MAEFANVCQHRWKLNYVDGRRSSVYSIHFDFGIAIHEALEKHLTKKDPISVDAAIVMFIEKFRELYGKNNDKYNTPVAIKGVEDLVKGGTAIIHGLDKCDELKNAEVVHNEYPLFEKIDRDDHLDVKFKGFIDIVIKTTAKNGDTVLYVCDFKTCTRGWDQDTRQDRWKHFQVFLYKHYLCKKFDLDPKYVRTAFILLKKRPPKGTPPVEFFPVSAGPVSVQRSLDALASNITEMYERTIAATLKKNRESCKDKFGNTCPFFNTEYCD